VTASAKVILVSHGNGYVLEDMAGNEVGDLVGQVIGDEPVPGFRFLNPAEWATSGCIEVVCMKRLDKDR
jgi:hypothetical protein